MNAPSRAADLIHKVWFITGASSGLGLELARAALKRGDFVVATSRAVTSVLGDHDNLLSVRLDVTDEAQAVAAAKAAVERFGRIDVLVNNAGIAPVPPSLLDVTEDLFDKTIGVNLRGPLRLTALAAEHMPSGGSVINISSKASLYPSSFTVVYAAAKAGLNALTKAAANEFGPRGIRVNAIVCGTFHTDSLHRSLPSADLQNQMASRISLGRIAGADEIVGTALYLASDASSYLTGELILLDGG